MQIWLHNARNFELTKPAKSTVRTSPHPNPQSWVVLYRGTSLIRNRPTLAPDSRFVMSQVPLWRFLMSEVPLYKQGF